MPRFAGARDARATLRQLQTLLRAGARAWRATGLLVSAAIVGGCNDGDGLTTPASIENATRVYSLYALTGSAASLPAAYQFTSERLARPQILSSGGLNFDVAYDIGTDGKVRLLPARVLVPSPPAGAPVIGVQKMPQDFASLQRAPDRGYLVDSVGVLGVGETYAIEIRNSGCIYGEYFYAKVSVDSIIASERRIVLRSLVNRNCGYRALTDGVPKN